VAVAHESPSPAPFGLTKICARPCSESAQNAQTHIHCRMMMKLLVFLNLNEVGDQAESHFAETGEFFWIMQKERESRPNSMLKNTAFAGARLFVFQKSAENQKNTRFLA
jgi:hypothetical protein